MRKIFATAIATSMIAAASIAATPASAGGFGLYVGGYGWGGGYHHGWGHHYAPEIYVDVEPSYSEPVYAETAGDPHTAWCIDRFQTYDPQTDLYFYAPGKQRHCNSPYN